MGSDNQASQTTSIDGVATGYCQWGAFLYKYGLWGHFYLLHVDEEFFKMEWWFNEGLVGLGGTTHQN